MRDGWIARIANSSPATLELLTRSSSSYPRTSSKGEAIRRGHYSVVVVARTPAIFEMRASRVGF
jgi:hypothetical protein